MASPFSLADVYANIMAGTNVTIDRGTTGEITVSSVGHDGVANALTLNINGSVLTVTIGRSNGLPNLTQSITLPDSGGGGGTDDGVISDIVMANEWHRYGNADGGHGYYQQLCDGDKCADSFGNERGPEFGGLQCGDPRA